MKTALGLLLAFGLATCGGHPTPPPPGPKPVTFELDLTPITATTVVDGYAGNAPQHPDGTGKLLVTVPASLKYTRLITSAVGYRTDTRESQEPAKLALQPTPITLNRLGRRGLVRANGHGVQDDDGMFLGFGTSYFPAIGLERTEPNRLEHNLALLDERVDFVRIFGDVGPPPDAWTAVASRADLPDYWSVVGALFERLARHGLRAEVTIFAGSPVFQTFVQRAAFVDRWNQFLAAHEAQVWAVEISNEGLGAGSAADIANLAARLTVRHLKATTTQPDCNGTINYSPAHYERGAYPVYWRQPWGGQCPLPLLVANDEPEGIESSVNQDPDARHQAGAASNTWVSGNAWHVLHTGAGTYAQKNPLPPQYGPREANLDDQPTFLSTVNSIVAVRKLLPPDLPNWGKVNGSWTNSPVAGIGGPLEGRCYFAVSGTNFVGACGGSDVLALPITAARPMTVTLYDPLNARAYFAGTLAAGQRVPFAAGLDGAIMIGR